MWRERLWYDRASAIESRSALVYGAHPYEYDNSYMKAPSCFVGMFDDEDVLIAVNSAHLTGQSARSRGLFVLPEFRGQKIGDTLLAASIQWAKENKAKFIWTMPRDTSIKSYERVGFIKTSDWFQTETSAQNCFAKLDL